MNLLRISTGILPRSFSQRVITKYILAIACFTKWRDCVLSKLWQPLRAMTEAPKLFEYGGFTLKTDATTVFRPHYRKRNSKMQQSTAMLDLCFPKTRSEKLQDNYDASFEKLCF